MSTSLPQQLPLSRRSFPVVSLMAYAVFSVALLAIPASLLAQASAPPAPTAQKPPAASPTHKPAHKTVRRQVRPSSAKPQTAAAPVPPPEPPPIEIPHWPVNDRPAEAIVTWDNKGLRISASNSSLMQILAEVSTVTGVKVDGISSDQRVFGVYGPGQARDVLSQVLQGSGYNVVMIGDLGQGAPRQIVLTSRGSGGTPPPPIRNAAVASDDDADTDADDPPQPPPPPAQPAPVVPMRPNFGGANPANPGGQPRTPQELLQDIQQRQQQQQQPQ